MSSALQRPLIREDRRRCVLATVESAREKLGAWGATEDTVRDLIESGDLVAWNIAGDPKTSARCWAILPESIQHFDTTGGSRPFNWTEKRILARVLEGQHDIIRGDDLCLVLNCSVTHVNALIDSGDLVEMPGTKRRTGPNGSARIARATVEKFLKTREAEKWT